MGKKKYVLNVVDFLVGVAVLMILAGLIAPYFIKPTNTARARVPASPPATTQPAR